MISSITLNECENILKFQIGLLAYCLFLMNNEYHLFIDYDDFYSKFIIDESEEVSFEKLCTVIYSEINTSLSTIIKVHSNNEICFNHFSYKNCLFIDNSIYEKDRLNLEIIDTQAYCKLKAIV